ncbi:MAG: ImmA/IrrE family metallo-endopeptidase [Lachnospiraceae bacterium]|nr:ImmA/IrrE family metallo-endopeptidase [Lachnospiraceae bacterium]
MDIKKKATTLVRKHQTRNPFSIIQGLNAILIFAPLQGVRGFYHYFQRNNIIYIDENLALCEQELVCAHELGHMFLHKKANTIFMDTRTQFNTQKYELEANEFAMHLLIGDDVIQDYQDYTLEQLARFLGYQIELIELRLK